MLAKLRRTHGKRKILRDRNEKEPENSKKSILSKRVEIRDYIQEKVKWNHKSRRKRSDQLTRSMERPKKSEIL